MPNSRLKLRWLPLTAILLLAGTALTADIAAQEARPSEAAPSREGRPNRPAESRPPEDKQQRLPAEAVTHHTLDLGDRKLTFTATAGALPLTNAQGRVTAEIAFVAYTLDGTDPRQRPITFAFNGGPGSASSWLHLGTLGPWRLRMDEAAISPSAPPTLSPNTETWLDFTDLVFIDPVGTGYSHIVTSDTEAADQKSGGRREGGEDSARRYFWSVNGDVESISDFIQKWLQKSARLASPKMLVGESYGGFRGPRVARKLQEKHGVGLNALVLISPVLDFGGRRGPSPLGYVSVLPSLAAAALERDGKPVSRERLKAVEDYARVEFLNDLMRGPRDDAALSRIIPRVAEITGLPPETVKRFGGRIDGRTYNREVNRPDGKVASLYDASVKGWSADPTSAYPREPDPFMTAISAPLVSAMVDLYSSKLQWRVDRQYINSNGEANRSWVWGNSPSPPESVGEMKEALALDPRLRIIVAHGFTDLVTPYFGSELVLDQIPAYGDAQRLALIVQPGGHMFYTREDSRKAFREDALNLIERIIMEANAAKPGQ